jgi:hypothetical protein
MVCSQVDRDGLSQVWRADASILGMQPQTGDKVWSSSLGAGRRLRPPHH